MREHNGILESLAQLDRDRGRRAQPSVYERFGFFLHEPAELVDVELRVSGRRGQHAADRARDRPDARAAPRERPAGCEQVVEQRVARRSGLFRDLRQRLDRTSRHPAGTVRTVGPQLLDPLPQDRGHATIVACGGPVRKRRTPVRLLVLGARRTGLLAAGRARGLFVIAVDPDPGAPGFRLADRRAILPVDDEPALERLAEAGRIDRVIGFGSAVATAARIAARFSLPHPVSPRTGVLVTSRLRQRERLREARVPQTRWTVLSGSHVEPGFPCTVSPPDRKGRRLAEESSGAAEVTVTAVSREGEFEPLLGAGPAAAVAARAAEALGIRHGLTSTRLRLGVDGPRVVELRADVSDREAELCRLLHGIDLHALALDAALGRAEYVRFGTADAQVA